MNLFIIFYWKEAEGINQRSKRSVARKTWRISYIHSTLFLSPLFIFLYLAYPAGNIYSAETREEIGDCRRGDTYDAATLHILRCVHENRWTDGCKQTRRMSKLLSPMHPLSRFLCSSVLVSHPPPMSALRSRTHTLSRSLRLFGFILSGQRRSPVSRLSSCDNPTPLCVNSCTHRQRIPTGEHTAGNVYLA